MQARRMPITASIDPAITALRQVILKSLPLVLNAVIKVRLTRWLFHMPMTVPWAQKLQWQLQMRLELLGELLTNGQPQQHWDLSMYRPSPNGKPSMGRTAPVQSTALRMAPVM